MIYQRFIRFVLPLATTAIVFELGSQVLSGGIARVPQATQTLAAYGLAWGLILFLAAPLGQARELGLAMVDGRPSLLAVRRFVLLLGALLMLALASLSLTPLGYLVIERLHGIDAHLGNIVRTALFWLIPYPVLRGLTLFHAGLLLRVRRTALVSYSTISSLAVSIAAVTILLTQPWIQVQPILLPVLVTYIGAAVELAILFWGCHRYAAHLYSSISPPTNDAPAAPSMAEIVAFFWPLALILMIQELSRPLINLFISRGPDATAALATLAVLYTLGRIPYGWLNEIRNLATSFRDEAGTMATNMAAIRRFALGCCAISFTMMVVMFWTPLREVILLRWIGVEPELAARAVVPLHLFAFFSFVVTARAYYHGVALVERRTQAIALTAPARVTAIVATLTLFPFLGITGATLGISALLSGFLIEPIVAWWGLRRASPTRIQSPSPLPKHVESR